VAENTETLTFFTQTDDGVRLYVNNTLLIDKWVTQGSTEWSGSLAVVAGTKYELVMDYLQESAGYTAALSWSSPSIPKQVIPANKFYLVHPAGSVVLASGTSTSSAGRLYLFDRLGVRMATYAEVLRAKEAGHPGLIHKFDPRVAIGNHPIKVNEYGFDTGDWTSDAWWVVPLAP